MIELLFNHPVSDDLLSFTVIAARSDGQWIFCRHKGRTTYECPGGHREDGETIEETARRELYEETGALQYDLMPVCAYSIKGYDGVVEYKEAIYGMLFYAEICTFGALPDMEIESVSQMDIHGISRFEELPVEWTYPEIQPQLLEKANSYVNTIRPKTPV